MCLHVSLCVFNRWNPGALDFFHVRDTLQVAEWFLSAQCTSTLFLAHTSVASLYQGQLPVASCFLGLSPFGSGQTI